MENPVIMVYGAAGVGKKTLIHGMLSYDSKLENSSELFVSRSPNTLNITNRYYECELALVLCDKDESIRSCGPVEGLVLVFDLCERSTFSTIKQFWENTIEAADADDYSDSNLTENLELQIVVGTKMDLKLPSSLEPDQDVFDWCLEHGFEYVEVNARDPMHGSDSREKEHFPRLMEAVHSTMWSNMKRKKASQQPQQQLQQEQLPAPSPVPPSPPSPSSSFLTVPLPPPQLADGHGSSEGEAEGGVREGEEGKGYAEPLLKAGEHNSEAGETAAAAAAAAVQYTTSQRNVFTPPPYTHTNTNTDKGGGIPGGGGDGSTVGGDSGACLGGGGSRVVAASHANDRANKNKTEKVKGGGDIDRGDGSAAAAAGGGGGGGGGGFEDMFSLLEEVKRIRSKAIAMRENSNDQSNSKNSNSSNTHSGSAANGSTSGNGGTSSNGGTSASTSKCGSGEGRSGGGDDSVVGLGMGLTQGVKSEAAAVALRLLALLGADDDDDSGDDLGDDGNIGDSENSTVEG